MLIDSFGWPYFILTKCSFCCAAYHFAHFALTTIVHVINTLQLEKMFGNKKGFLAVLFMSNSGILLKKTLRYCDHDPNYSADENDYKNTGKQRKIQT